MIDQSEPEALFAALEKLLLKYPGLAGHDVTLPGEAAWRLNRTNQRAMHDPPVTKRTLARQYDRVLRRWRFENPALVLQLDLLQRPDGAHKAGLYGRSRHFPFGDANTAHATFKGRIDPVSGDYLVDFRSRPVRERLASKPPAWASLSAEREGRLLLGRELAGILIHRFLLATDLAAQARAGVVAERTPAAFFPPGGREQG